MPLKDFITTYRQRINGLLANSLQEAFQPLFATTDYNGHLDRLKQAMHYCLLSGGKRLRPLLVYGSAMAVGAPLPMDGNEPSLDAEQQTTLVALDRIACAIEMVHAYSLVHDDLPAMDDDKLRHGKPTCHLAFDEATAILVGDALQACAFEQLADLAGCAETKVTLIHWLARAAGPCGMVGGQIMDIEAVGKTIDEPHLQTMHQLKTGALIDAAVVMGAIFSGARQHQQAKLTQYARAIGLAFQMRDDILDRNGDRVTLGKQPGTDQARNKPTYPQLLGLEGTQKKVHALYQQALDALADFGQRAQILRDLSGHIVTRHY